MFNLFGTRRAKQELERLEKILEATKILKAAITHLEPLGTGDNLEWSNARVILEIALTNVMYEVK